LFVIRVFSQYVIENGPETMLNSYFHNFETQQTQTYLNDPNDPLALLLKTMIDYLIDTDKK